MAQPVSPSGHAPPRRSVTFLIVYALANAGGVIAYLPLLTLLLPMKVARLAGDARIDVLTATLIAGAVAASLSNILFGWLSDRSVANGGGRRRWVTGGVVATAASYALSASAETPLGIVVAIVVFQCAVNLLLSPLLAIMAEEIPDAQKGVAAGLLALGSPLASAVSTLLVTVAMLGEGMRFAIVPLVTAACVLPLLLSRAHSVPAAVAPPDRRIPRRDLAIAWTARLLVQVAGSVLSLYLLYYLESVSPQTPRHALAERAGHLLMIAFAVPLPIAIVIGKLSDRTGRRKPFLLASATVAASGVLGMGWATGWTAAALAFCAYASGSAVFLALHSAFAMQLLPSPEHRGRDLGLLNLTNTLPGLLGPLLAWTLATPQDFRGVMLALAAVTLCGGLMTLAARGQR
jgi:MFS family permease